MCQNILSMERAHIVMTFAFSSSFASIHAGCWTAYKTCIIPFVFNASIINKESSHSWKLVTICVWTFSSLTLQLQLAAVCGFLHVPKLPPSALCRMRRAGGGSRPQRSLAPLSLRCIFYYLGNIVKLRVISQLLLNLIKSLNLIETLR